MNPDQLERLRIARPFMPFTIHVSDGVTYRVPSPEFIIRTKCGRSISVLTDDGETFVIIDMIHVNGLSVDGQVDLAPEEPRRRPA